jgi:hypothetical protein
MFVEDQQMCSLGNVFRFISCHPFTHDHRIKAFARLVGWQIKSRFRRELIVSWIANQKLAVRRGMAGATGNIYTGLHESADMMFLLHFLRRGDLFLDIGANVGSYTDAANHHEVRLVQLCFDFYMIEAKPENLTAGGLCPSTVRQVPILW